MKTETVYTTKDGQCFQEKHLAVQHEAGLIKLWLMKDPEIKVNDLVNFLGKTEGREFTLAFVAKLFNSRLVGAPSRRKNDSDTVLVMPATALLPHDGDCGCDECLIEDHKIQINAIEAISVRRGLTQREQQTLRGLKQTLRVYEERQ